MQTLNDILNDYNRKIREEIIHKDVFINWQRSIVTQRLFNECSSVIFDLVLDDFPIENMEEVAMKAVYKKGMKDAFEMIIEWKPEELQ